MRNVKCEQLPEYLLPIILNANFYLFLFQEGKTQFELNQPEYLSEMVENLAKSSNNAVAPMPGVLDKILVKPGDKVSKGDSLFVLIAMKMEHIVTASRDAIISTVLYKPGENVLKDSVVIEFEKNE